MLKKMMIVEDSELEAQHVEIQLRHLGFDRVFMYSDFRSAADAYRKSPNSWRGAIIDMLLVGSEDGLSLAKYLRRKTPDLPILFLTGYDLESTIGLSDDVNAVARVVSKRAPEADRLSIFRDVFM